MNGWPWNAFVGQKVIFVDDESLPGRHWIHNDQLIVGAVYTIERIGEDPNNIVNLMFSVVERSRHPLSVINGFWGYAAFRFRPVQTIDTSARVAEIKRLALGVRDEVRA